MVVFDGNNRRIVLSGATTFSALDIYNAAKDWDSQPSNMKYPCPMDAVGKAVLGSNAYTDAVFRLLSGWKLQPQGYAQGTQITVTGTLVTSDGSVRTVAPTSGNEVTWLFQVASAATVIETNGSGTGGGTTLTPDEIFSTVLPELSAGEIPATPTVKQVFQLLWAMTRNKQVSSDDKLVIHNDAGEPIAEAAVETTDASVTRGRLTNPS